MKTAPADAPAVTEVDALLRAIDNQLDVEVDADVRAALAAWRRRLELAELLAAA